jgi:hypothetical protein
MSLRRCPRGRILAVLVAGAVVVSVICAAVLTRRDPALGDRVGSIVADEYPSGSLIPGLQRLGAWVTWIRPS